MSNSVNLAATDKQLLKRYLEIPQPDDKVMATYVRKKFYSYESFLNKDIQKIRFGSMELVKTYVQKQ